MIFTIPIKTPTDINSHGLLAWYIQHKWKNQLTYIPQIVGMIYTILMWTQTDIQPPTMLAQRAQRHPTTNTHPPHCCQHMIFNIIVTRVFQKYSMCMVFCTVVIFCSHIYTDIVYFYYFAFTCLRPQNIIFDILV